MTVYLSLGFGLHLFSVPSVEDTPDVVATDEAEDCKYQSDLEILGERGCYTEEERQDEMANRH